jgi:hypothetical protein
VQLLANCKYARNEDVFDADEEIVHQVEFDEEVTELSELIAGENGFLKKEKLDSFTESARIRLKNAKKVSKPEKLISRVTFIRRNGYQNKKSL